MAEEPHKATSVANRSSGLLLTNSCLLAQSLTADVCMNKGLLGKPAGIAHNMCVYLVDLKSLSGTRECGVCKLLILDESQCAYFIRQGYNNYYPSCADNWRLGMSLCARAHVTCNLASTRVIASVIYKAYFFS